MFAFEAVKQGIARVLSEDEDMDWYASDIREDLSKKMTSYNGEEIGTPEILTMEQVEPALPPATHGGSIPVASWVDGRTLWYLTHPDECVVEDKGQELPKLQKKVHVLDEDRLDLGNLLVNRRICTWVPEQKVHTFRGTRILNGLFGVKKDSKVPSGKSVLRLVMNLIPTNAILKEIRGRVDSLPNICSWCNIVLEEDELLSICQSDMTAAFYLFSLPEGWPEKLCFNLAVKGREIGKTGVEAEENFYLAARVLPMGWASAVGLMQTVAEEVLLSNGMPTESQIRRPSPLPPWVTDSMDRGSREQRVWWHVSLDNYASGERRFSDEVATGGEWQSKVEGWWQEAGILSSKKKMLQDSLSASELGAFFSGNYQWMGASTLRLFKLVKSTFWVITQPRLKRKMLQILMGRWIFVLQFRRPAMAHFEKVWDFISAKTSGQQAENGVKEELFSAVMSICLLHTFLGAKIDDETTCSDASTVGGAIARARTLTPAGKGFLQAQLPENLPIKVPIVVVSLFNGIGGSFRSMDIAGARIVGGISVDIHKASNRVSQRRWPHVLQWDDIRTFTASVIESHFETFGYFEYIDIWGGFPCVDLSSAKAHRENLAGTQSSLIFEAIRVINDIQVLFPGKIIRFFIENVASMDVTARDEISRLLGVEPYRIDCRFQVPMARPRFCWTNCPIVDLGGVSQIIYNGYIELSMEGPWPEATAWLEDDCEQYCTDVVYPTCMKAIRRPHPPVQPAGISRCDDECISRVRRQRVRKRAGLTLEDRALKASTRARYFEGVRKVLPLLSKDDSIDNIVSEWIEDEYTEGAGVTSIADTLSGLRHFAPFWKGHLNRSWKLYRLWRKLERPAQAPPFPQVFAEALVARQVELGNLTMGLTLALGFWGMLRTGELMTLRTHQLMLGKKDLVIQLGFTKTGTRRQQDENVVVHHLPTILLAEAVLEARLNQGRLRRLLYSRGPLHFRKEFKVGLDFFKMGRHFRHAFAAVRQDGTVVTWGDEACGGDSSGVQDQLHGVREIAASSQAFAAILDDGTVVTWGNKAGV
eukprot:Skav200576  [mRNA]  locus=scaffold917:283975:288745:- [translate_table: standard]